MSCWQYARLTITVDGRDPMAPKLSSGMVRDKALGRTTRTAVTRCWNCFGGDGWELAGLQDYREGGDGSSYWEAARLLTIYTFKRPVPEYGDPAIEAG